MASNDGRLVEKGNLHSFRLLRVRIFSEIRPKLPHGSLVSRSLFTEPEIDVQE